MGLKKRKNPIKLLPSRGRESGLQRTAMQDASNLPAMGGGIGGVLGGLLGGTAGFFAAGGPTAGVGAIPGAALGAASGASVGSQFGAGAGQALAGMSQTDFYLAQSLKDDQAMLDALRADQELEQWARQKAIDLSTLELVSAQATKPRPPGYKWSGADIGR